MSPLAGSNTPREGGWGAEEVGIDWNTVMTLLEGVEVVVAELSLDVENVSADEESEVDAWVVLVAAMGDDVDVACGDENEA